jgi:transcriptional regulator with XRE-family HTH domain
MLVMTDKMTFGARLKEVRKNKNMTQKQLGKLSKIQHSSISEYESETTEPSGKNLFKIAQALGVSVEYLMTGKNPEGFVVNGDNNFQVGHGNTSYGYGSKQHTVKSDEQSSEIKRLNDEIARLNNAIMALNDEIKQEKDKRLELMQTMYDMKK